MACPRCGAAIFYPTAWWSITPPPPQYTCGCFASERTAVSTSTTVLYVQDQIKAAKADR